MKIGIFTDSHYSTAEVTCNNRYNSRSLEKIKKAFTLFQEEGCELVICLGDLIDREEDHAQEIVNLKQAADVIHSFELPFISVQGNHDGFAFEKEEFYNILGKEHEPRNMDFGDARLVFLDACYFHTGKHYTRGDSDWTDTWVPDTSVLEKELAEAKGNVYIFVHQNIDPMVQRLHLIGNAPELQRMIRESGKVKMVCQGHFHPGRISAVDGVCYRSYPAMCCYEDAAFILNI